MPGRIGPWNLASGQVTDDSELAMAMLTGLVNMPKGKFDALLIGDQYSLWYKSDPFIVGNTTSTAFQALIRDVPRD